MEGGRTRPGRSDLPIPFQALGIVQPPCEYEDRLQALPIPGLKHSPWRP
jgi:hypothetical protein